MLIVWLKVIHFDVHLPPTLYLLVSLLKVGGPNLQLGARLLPLAGAGVGVVDREVRGVFRVGARNPVPLLLLPLARMGEWGAHRSVRRRGVAAPINSTALLLSIPMKGARLPLLPRAPLVASVRVFTGRRFINHHELLASLHNPAQTDA